MRYQSESFNRKRDESLFWILASDDAETIKNTHTMNQPESLQRQEFLSGVRDTFPLLLGALPFGLIYGAVAATSGLSVTAAVAMSAFVFAGASQFIAGGWLPLKPRLRSSF